MVRYATGTTTVVNHRKFDAFGNLTAESDATVKFLYSYTGREWDGDAGLYYYRARWYDAKIGRFISEDPIGFAAGDTNVTRYVRNNTPNGTDPTGLQDGLEVRLNIANRLALEESLRKQAEQHTPNGRPTPNTGAGAGNIWHHSCHTIVLRVPRGQDPKKFMERIYEDLKKFTYFNGNHNTEARVEVRPNGEYAYFQMIGWDGFFSTHIVGNAKEVPVKLSYNEEKYLVMAQTLEGHMLEGIRTWRVSMATEAMYGGQYVQVVTGSRDRPVGTLNNYGAAIAGTEAQMLVWTQYLQNFAEAYGQTAIVETQGPRPLLGN